MDIKDFLVCAFVCVILSTITSCDAVTIRLPLVTGTVNHATCANPESGSITQSLTFLNPNDFNTTHIWNNGAVTANIQNLSPIYPAQYIDHVQLTSHVPGGVSLSEVEKYDVLYSVDEWQMQSDMIYSKNEYKLICNAPYAHIGSVNVLPANALGYFEFTVESDGSNNSGSQQIGFNPVSDLSTGSISRFTGMLILNSSRYIYLFKDGNILPIGSTYVLTDRFKMEYKNNCITYYRNNTPITSEFLGLAGHPESYIHVYSYDGNNVLSVSNINATFGCVKAADYFSGMVKDIGGECYTMTGSLKFKYLEKYNDNVLNYTVYDWRRNPVLTYPGNGPAPVASNLNGVNYHTILVGNKLNYGSNYILEITNSKNEIYKMRFSYNNFSVEVPSEYPTVIMGPRGPIRTTVSRAISIAAHDYD
jgi:hypothetical protein